MAADRLSQAAAWAGANDGPAPPGRLLHCQLAGRRNEPGRQGVRGCSRFDEDGTLILSRFTGAARELTNAVLVNPFAVDEVAAAIHQCLTMPEEERRKRMQRMRAIVAENNIYRWAGKFLSELLKFDLPESPRPRQQLEHAMAR